MIEKGELILRMGRDHSYELVYPYYTQVVWNTKYDSYSEYGGMEYMTDKEKLVMAWVIE